MRKDLSARYSNANLDLPEARRRLMQPGAG